jgi:hypothetical protein
MATTLAPRLAPTQNQLTTESDSEEEANDHFNGIDSEIGSDGEGIKRRPERQKDAIERELEELVFGDSDALKQRIRTQAEDTDVFDLYRGGETDGTALAKAGNEDDGEDLGTIQDADVGCRGLPMNPTDLLSGSFFSTTLVQQTM